MKTPPSQQPPFPERTLEHIKQEHQRFMEAGGNLKDVKKFHNCIAEPLFDIPIDNVSISYSGVLVIYGSYSCEAEGVARGQATV